MKLGKVLASALALSLLAGCASFPGDQVPETQIPSVTQYQQKPGVYVDFTFFGGEPNSPSAVPMPQARDMLKPRLEQLLADSKLFSHYTLDSFQKQPGDYTLRLKVYNHGSVGAAMASGFLTGFSLFVIPGSAKDEYRMSAELLGPDGQQVTQRSNDESVRTWMGIWFLPLAGNTPQEAITDAFSRQFNALLKELVDNQSLKFAQRPSPLLRG
jgi:hypothetical protein